MRSRILAALLALALLLAAVPAARASCWGGPCDDILLPGEQTTLYLPTLSGEGPACADQPYPCPEE